MVNPLNTRNPHVDAPASSSVPASKTTTPHSKSSDGQSAQAVPADRVSVSGRGHVAGRLTRSAHDSNGVDPARVQAIRQQLAQGGINTSPRDIAAAMLQAHATGQ
ncbi:flagellar biosynthesis anti-sigma factor FlgM [Salinisphaera sp. RV14]|uniref:flagellar biosynthesis anti-sigma factor FlgM n=1 Tax=unclassified Salinisphaera TaxID=2649847 RepID=UPI003F8292A3